MLSKCVSKQKKIRLIFSQVKWAILLLFNLWDDKRKSSFPIWLKEVPPEFTWKSFYCKPQTFGRALKENKAITIIMVSNYSNLCLHHRHLVNMLLMWECWISVQMSHKSVQLQESSRPEKYIIRCPPPITQWAHLIHSHH